MGVARIADTGCSIEAVTISCLPRGWHRTSLGALVLGHAGQVTDHTAGPVGQGHLDRPVQILANILEPADDLKDHRPADGMGSDRDPLGSGRGVSQLRQLG